MLAMSRFGPLWYKTCANRVTLARGAPESRNVPLYTGFQYTLSHGGKPTTTPRGWEDNNPPREGEDKMAFPIKPNSIN